MKQITFNPSNEPYYSDDFIKGFKCGAQRQLEADKADIPTWIPCSERLPEYLEKVLMSTFWGVRVGFRDHTERSGDFWNIIENDSTVAPHSVYAWMPLPKPYKETDHE